METIPIPPPPPRFHGDGRFARIDRTGSILRISRVWKLATDECFLNGSLSFAKLATTRGSSYCFSWLGYFCWNEARARFFSCNLPCISFLEIETAGARVSETAFFFILLRTVVVIFENGSIGESFAHLSIFVDYFSFLTVHMDKLNCWTEKLIILGNALNMTSLNN